MKRLLLLPLLLAAAPVNAAENLPAAQLAFTVERAGAVVASGSIFPSGYDFTETIGQAYPRACPQGEVEYGYRQLKLAVSYPNGRGDRFTVYLSDDEQRDIPDPEEDPCLSVRTPPRDYSFHDSVTLLPGEETQLDAGEGLLIRLRRIQ